MTRKRKHFNVFVPSVFKCSPLSCFAKRPVLADFAYMNRLYVQTNLNLIDLLINNLGNIPDNWVRYDPQAWVIWLTRLSGLKVSFFYKYPLNCHNLILCSYMGVLFPV